MIDRLGAVGMTMAMAMKRTLPASLKLRLGRLGTTRSILRNTITQYHTSTPTQTSPSSSSTINPSEIEHFSSLSAHWWDEHGEFGLLHRMNPPRVQFIREKVLEAARDDGEESERVLEGLSVLDVGCGGGLLAESLARLGAHTTAIDASASNIAIASLHASHDPSLRSKLADSVTSRSGESGSLEYRHASSEDLLNEGRQFDVVCSMEVLEHVDNPVGFLQSVTHLVKPGGHLFLSTISRTALSYALTILAAEHILRLVSPGTHTHSKYIRPEELLEFFTKPIGHDCLSSTHTPNDNTSIRHASNTDSRSASGNSGALPSTNRNETGMPWISRLYDGAPTRTEAEVRGIVYVPWSGKWELAPRGMGGFATECNYLFWVRKPIS